MLRVSPNPVDVYGPQRFRPGSAGLISASIYPSVIDPFSGRMTPQVVTQPLLIRQGFSFESKPVGSIQPLLNINYAAIGSWPLFLLRNAEAWASYGISHPDVFDLVDGPQDGVFLFPRRGPRKLQSKLFFHLLFIAGVSRILGSNLKSLLEAQKKRARNALRKLVLHREKIKASNRPLLFLPHSLHPNVSDAH